MKCKAKYRAGGSGGARRPNAKYSPIGKTNNFIWGVEKTYILFFVNKL